MFKRMMLASLLTVGMAQECLAVPAIASCGHVAIAVETSGITSYIDTLNLTGINNFYGSTKSKSMSFTLTKTNQNSGVNLLHIPSPADDGKVYSIPYAVSNGSTSQTGNIYVGDFGNGGCQVAAIPSTNFFHATAAGTFDEITTILISINNP